MARLFLACLAVLAALAAPARAQPAAAPAPAAAACPALLDKTFPRLQDEQPQSLCQYAGKVLLVVNTASYCGFTPQYKGLEELHAKYKDRGLVVLGFPSNDFLQEKSSNKDIAEFCENTFGVKFPMFAASGVRGSGANALFKDLAARTGHAPIWNFNKYLVARDGRAVAWFGSTTTPQDSAFVAQVERLLGQR